MQSTTKVLRHDLNLNVRMYNLKFLMGYPHYILYYMCVKVSYILLLIMYIHIHIIIWHLMAYKWSQREESHLVSMMMWCVFFYYWNVIMQSIYKDVQYKTLNLFFLGNLLLHALSSKCIFNIILTVKICITFFISSK